MTEPTQLPELWTGKLANRDRAVFLSSDLPDVRWNDPLSRIDDIPLFCRLTVDDRRSILSAGREQFFQSHRGIFRQGDPASGIFVLATGRVKLTRLSRTGDQILLRIVDKGEVIGQLGLSAGSWHTLTAKTMEPSRILTWGIQVFQALCERTPGLASNSLHILANSQRVLEERFLEQITEPAEARLARLLVRLLEKGGCSIHKPARIEGLLRRELAQMIGTTIFTVSRLLCQWERLGILEPQRETVVIKNPRRLIRFADAMWTNNGDD